MFSCNIKNGETLFFCKLQIREFKKIHKMFCRLLSSLGKTFYDFLHLLENVQRLGLGSGMNAVPGNYSATCH